MSVVPDYFLATTLRPEARYVLNWVIADVSSRHLNGTVFRGCFGVMSSPARRMHW